MCFLRLPFDPHLSEEGMLNNQLVRMVHAVQHQGTAMRGTAARYLPIGGACQYQ